MDISNEAALSFKHWADTVATQMMRNHAEQAALLQAQIDALTGLVIHEKKGRFILKNAPECPGGFASGWRGQHQAFATRKDAEAAVLWWAREKAAGRVA